MRPCDGSDDTIARQLASIKEHEAQASWHLEINCQIREQTRGRIANYKHICFMRDVAVEHKRAARLHMQAVEAYRQGASNSAVLMGMRAYTATNAVNTKINYK
jgi:hypothetical protein